VLNIYDALYKHQNEIKHYLTSHEQGAAHAADGYARATGKVGVCLATSGPGACNLVTGIATAYMDSIPLVAITGNVSLNYLGRDSFQEVDITGITMPITKHNFIVKDVAELADTVRKAFYIAKKGRPGPVLIDITKDVTAAMYEYTPAEPYKIEKRTSTITEEDITAAVELIKNSKKPFIYCGGGCINSEASEEIIRFVENQDMPVSCSSMGLGVVPANHPNYTGMIGMHGTKTSNLLANECDLFIAMGARFSDRVATNFKTFVPNAKVLHIDIDPAEINKNIVATQSIIGDVNEIVKRLNERLEKAEHKEWLEKANEYKAKYPLMYDHDGTLKPQYIMERINAICKGEEIIVTEVGQHQMWACQFIENKYPRHFLTSGGLGTMGYGLGAAIGAKVGKPDKVVFNIAGDGCFYMNHIEMATAVANSVPIIEIVINNHVLGMVRQWQDLFYDARYSQTNLDKATDFVKLGEAYKAATFNVTKPEEVDDAIKAAIECGKPALIICEIGRDEKVFPMIPAGKSCEDMITLDEYEELQQN
ncbi:MAG: biosynthetic-type acetolactate synthase large subunit, partial [Clostridia bacterium]|nr:biosynthetic-type acetolactate synthase large subunit [Clostridia bacterium]